MTELSLNILDIACNSVTAKATLVVIDITIDEASDKLHISITDNGKGMSEELLGRVTDPFSTSRTTRRVGMGLPLFQMSALMCDGAFDISSVLGQGTVVKTSYRLSHIDRTPLGDIASSISILIGQAPSADFVLNYTFNGELYTFDTRDIKAVLEGEPIDNHEVLCYIQEVINENMSLLNGGILI